MPNGKRQAEEFSDTANILDHPIFCCSIYSHMAITFDTEKNARNIAERGLSFGRVAELDWDTALVVEDTRRDYGETRLLVVTPRGEDLRVISFRRANGREVRLYGEKGE
jgi:uncharacterized DUF497 family protein